MLGISADDEHGLLAMQTLTRGALALYRDPTGDTIRALGLAEPAEEVPHQVARPCAYVIDACGLVRYRYVSRSAEDRPRTALLLLAAEATATPQAR